MNNEVFTLNVRKAIKRRNTEYIALIAFFAFFAYNFISETGAVLFAILFGVAIIMGFCLCQKREDRRIMDFANRFRATMDIIESLTFMLAIAVLSIVALINQFPFVVFESYLSYALLGFFIGTLFGETFWRNKNFRKLNRKEIVNYANNLNSSVILPFNFDRKGKYQ